MTERSTNWTSNRRRSGIPAASAFELVRRIPVNRSTVSNQMRGATAATMRRVPFPLRPPTTPQGVELPKIPGKLGADYDTAWARRYPARFARVLMVEGVVKPMMRVLASPTIRGLDQLHDLDGAAVFAANHHSHLDTPLMLSAIPDPWRHHMIVGAAADYFFGNKLTAPLSALVIGAIPIERTKIGRKSADQAASLIDDGWSMLIFPEGGRSPDGWGQPFRGGAAYLSLRCEVPVIPVHVEGTSRILRKGHSVPSPSPTTITFGRPMTADAGEDSRKFAVRIEAAVAALADEEATDWWQARRRAHGATTPSLQGPELGAWRRTWSLGERGPKRRRPARWPDLG
ncbi:MAG: lysophospholipid acyltransferase family protein [Actinomycetes bacterium]